MLTLTFREVATHELGLLHVPSSDEGDTADRLHQLKSALDIKELFYLTTCNRVLFFYYSNAEADTKFLLKFFKQINPELTEAQFSTLADKVRVLEGEQALNHLFEIAASIDSMVVGEREILRQLRTAYEACAAQGLCGDYIRLAIQEAVRTAKDIYHQTRIGEKPVSIVSLSIKALLERQPDRQQRVVLLGAGQTMHLVAKFLRKHKFNNVTVFNRSLDKATAIANSFGGKAYTLDQIAEYKDGFDLLITCTGHTSSWIDQGIYKQLLSGDPAKKIVVDLAVPTNLQPALRDAFDIDYIQVNDLRKIAKQNIAFREKEVESARQIIVAHEQTFKMTLAERKMEKALKDIPTQIKDIKSKAINEVFKKDLEALDANSLELISKMMDYMEKKCISIPMKAAKKIVREV